MGSRGPPRSRRRRGVSFFLAVELLLLHRTMNLDRLRAVFGLVPLFLLWANISDSFLIGLLVLAATVIGHCFRKSTPQGSSDPLLGVEG